MADAPLVAAASDLRFALDEIAAQFARDTGNTVRIVYGSSGNFRRQIAEGAPFELFLSADEALRAGAGEGRPHRRRAARSMRSGRIVLFVPDGSPLKLDPTPRRICARRSPTAACASFAIANPEHAPYGRAAQRGADGRRRCGTRSRPRLVLGENVSQAAQFATSGVGAGRHHRVCRSRCAPGVLGSWRATR